MASDLNAENHTRPLPAPITELRPEAKELLADYVGMPEDQMLAHVEYMRDKAWKTTPYGCIGHSVFAIPSVQRQAVYSKVLEGLKAGKKFLDLGCGFGQNMRKLIVDGAPAENVYGADISNVLVDCGYEFFKDGNRLNSKFIIGDVFDSSSSAYAEAKENFDFVFASMLYHLWGWDDQVKGCIETIKLLKPVPGSVLFGWQVGSMPAGEVERVNSMAERHKRMYQHDEESWKRMWKEIEEKTETKWDVQAKSILPPEFKDRFGAQMPTNEGSELSIITFTMIRK